MKNSLHIFFFLSISFLLLTACNSDPTVRSLDLRDDSYTTDAKLRVVTSLKPGVATRPGRIDPETLVCVEPTPDVVSALASGSSGGLSLFGKGSGSFTNSQSEGLVQLAERTTAIQAILKQGYQACLDYANGAITSTTYSLRTSRLDDLLVTLILSEAAAGAYGRSGAALGGNASAEASALLSGIPDAMQDLEESRKQLNEANKEVSDLKTKVDEAKKAFESAPENDNATQKANYESLKTQLDAKIAERNALIQSLSVLSEAVAKSTAAIDKVTAMGGIDREPSAEIAKVLAQMQYEFVNKDIDQAYISTCLTELGMWPEKSIFNDYRDGVFQKIERLLESGKPIPKELENAYFRSASSYYTHLTEHCIDNLNAFVKGASLRNHDIKIKQLELEIEKTKLEQSTKEDIKEIPSTVFHPKLSFTQLEKINSGFKKAKKKFSAIKKPCTPSKVKFNKVFKSLSKSHRGICKAIDEIDKYLTEHTSNSAKRKLDALEAKYAVLIIDPRQHSEEATRKLWRAELNLQQSKAKALFDSHHKVISRIKMVKRDIYQIKSAWKKLSKKIEPSQGEQQ